MSKRHKAVVNLQDFKDKAEREGTILIKADDAEFRMRLPQFLSDDDLVALRNVEDGDLIGQAKVVLDDYEGFVAAGGSAALALSILEDALSDVDPAEAGNA